MQRRADPGIIFSASEQMPDNHRELAGDRNRGDVIAAAAGDALVEGPQRPKASDCLPSSLNQHAARVRGPLLGDRPMPWAGRAGLMHARVQAEIVFTLHDLNAESFPAFIV